MGYQSKWQAASFLRGPRIHGQHGEAQLQSRQSIIADSALGRFPLYFGSEIKDPEVAVSRTNYRRKCTACTALQQYLISICVIMVQFQLTKTKHDNY